MVDKLSEEQELAVTKFYKNNLGALSRTKILEKFNSEDRGYEISYYQLTRIAREWKETGGYEDWLFETWFHLHRIIEDKDPSLAYKRVSSLMEKLITRKYKHQVDGKVKLEASDKVKELVRGLFAEERIEPAEPPA